MKIIKKQCAEMLAALAAAKKDPSLRMKRNGPKMGRDICVAVEAATGELVCGDGVDPANPKTWPFVIMLFGADMIGAQKRIKKGGNPCTVLSRFYAWNPFDPPPSKDDKGILHMTVVGDDIQHGAALVKVAERQVDIPHLLSFD